MEGPQREVLGFCGHTYPESQTWGIKPQNIGDHNTVSSKCPIGRNLSLYYAHLQIPLTLVAEYTENSAMEEM